MKRSGNELILLSDKIKRGDIKQNRVASIGNYSDSLSLAYFSNQIYLGELGSNLSSEQLNKLLAKFTIDELWVWSGDRLTIYQVK